jgi:hypothetical protein
MWEQTKQRQSARVIQERAAGGDPDTLLVKREDMLGPKFLEVSACKALQQLQVRTNVGCLPCGDSCTQTHANYMPKFYLWHVAVAIPFKQARWLRMVQ